MRQGYKLNFKMFMEGVEIPFKSATITCTPNGAEASINIYSSENAYSIKPKTSVHIFFKEWFGSKPEWKLLFDGYFSSFYEIDEATEGRMLAMICRDFRMDMRKTSAALVMDEVTSLGTYDNLFNIMGVFKEWSTGSINPNEQKKENIIVIDNSLETITSMAQKMAGTAGFKGMVQKNGEYGYTNYIDLIHNTNAGSFLDAIVRGMWIQSVGGVAVATFLNKRLRADKKFLIPKHRAGTLFWYRDVASIIIGSHIMGNAGFTSIEAAIMRVAGLFNTRVYSCNSPSLIPVKVGEPSNEFVIDESVRDYMVDKNGAEFGAKYILNETMLLPPLEFTAPPNCNILFPSMYERVEWRQDYDVDYTRGYFRLTNTLSSEESMTDPLSVACQVPNDLVRSLREDTTGRVKPPLTDEEKYKGVNVLFDTVEDAMAQSDLQDTLLELGITPEARDRILAEVDKLNESIELDGLSDVEKQELKNQIELLRIERTELDRKSDEIEGATHGSAVKRHAMIKFVNSRYLGRVASVDGMFNPYVVCGFPALIISGKLADTGRPIKDIIGMVQQVRHSIVITTGGGDAATSLTVSTPRFTDEPTDMDPMGSPLYMKETDPVAAEIDINTLEYVNSNYLVKNPSVRVSINNAEDKSVYDTINIAQEPDYKYAKDLLTLCGHDRDSAKRTTLYIDKEYEPNHIAKFYKLVLRHKKDSLMVGSYIDEHAKKKYFMYDSIHEAVENLKMTMPPDYEQCMEYVSRDICSADAFFHGILGATSLVDGEYINKVDNFDGTILHKEYHGVSNLQWNNDPRIKPLTVNEGGLMDLPGALSSITENMPFTYFIKERRDTVMNYHKSVYDPRRYTQYG